MRWPFLTLTDDLPEGMAGRSTALSIEIRPAYREDEGLYQHELCHVFQWIFTLGLHGLLVKWRPYRLWSEVQAYRRQLRYLNRWGQYPTVEELAARLCGPGYDLRITPERAVVLLKSISE